MIKVKYKNGMHQHRKEKENMRTPGLGLVFVETNNVKCRTFEQFHSKGRNYHVVQNNAMLVPTGLTNAAANKSLPPES